jgi:hypothetical protein
MDWKRYLVVLAFALVGCTQAQAATDADHPGVVAEPNRVCASCLLPSDIVTADYAATHGEHVLVDFSAGVAKDILIQAPPSNPALKGVRFKISEVSADGGVGTGLALGVIATDSLSVADSVFASGLPHIVANNGLGQSKVHASIELLDFGNGWIVVEEGSEP